MKYSFFDIQTDSQTAVVYLNRPEKRNMMSLPFWEELPQVMDSIASDSSIKTVIIAGHGRSFSAGLDIEDFIERFDWFSQAGNAQNVDRLLSLIQMMQSGINKVAQIPQPVIAAVHSHCIGGALDLISACDIRVAAKNALFSLREVKVDIVADMGSLQRLPAIIGEGHTRELAFTGKDIDAEQALAIGLVTHIYNDKEEMVQKALELAHQLNENSSLVMKGIKHIMNYGQNHSLDSSLSYVRTYNAGFLQSQEFLSLLESVKQRMLKKKARKNKK